MTGPNGPTIDDVRRVLETLKRDLVLVCHPDEVAGVRHVIDTIGTVDALLTVEVQGHATVDRSTLVILDRAKLGVVT